MVWKKVLYKKCAEKSPVERRKVRENLYAPLHAILLDKNGEYPL